MASPGIAGSTFCALPWMHLFVSEEGHFYPCCVGTSTGGPLLSESGQPIQAGSVRAIENAWECEDLRILRRQLLNRERPERCGNCWKSEDAGLPSYRQMMLKEFEASAPLPSIDKLDDRPPLRFRYIDLRLGNLCNLRCRMCGPQSSRLLAREWSEIYLGREDPEAIARWNSMDWYSNPEFWTEIMSYVPHIDRLHFAGGEPLLAQEGFDFLRRVIQAGYASQIRLSYNTNLTRIPADAFEIWSHFKEVKVICSVDGFGEVNEYIRFPSKWPELASNLKRLDRAARDSNVKALINTTVQAYNVMRLGELFEFMMAEFDHIDPFPSLIPLMTPDYLSTQILPKAIKDAAAERLLSFKVPTGLRDRPDHPLFEMRLKGLVEWMYQKDETRLIPEFLRVTRILDRRREQELETTIPELSFLTSASAALQPAVRPHSAWNGAPNTIV